MSGVRELPPELHELAVKNLNETPARITEDLAAVREWLKKQPHLPQNIDDQWILTFLRGCKYSLERTKEKLDAYYTARTIIPELFQKRDPLLPELQELIKLGITIPLPQPDHHGRTVFIVRNGVYSPHKHDVNDIMKLSFMTMDLILRDSDRVPIAGDVHVVDLKGITLAHGAQMSPPVVKKIMTLYQEAYPLRPKGIHHFNVLPGIEYVFNIFKSFMKKKLRERLFVHGSEESLFKEVPQDILPSEYGGKAGTCAQLAEQFRKKLEDNRDWFVAQEKVRSDESKRIGKIRAKDSTYGLVGSFKKLEVD